MCGQRAKNPNHGLHRARPLGRKTGPRVCAHTASDDHFSRSKTLGLGHVVFMPSTLSINTFKRELDILRVASATFVM